ncbi:hypothetical protein PENTCL1PPCAC_14596, partial [Pristionchus entomophagus]
KNAGEVADGVAEPFFDIGESEHLDAIIISYASPSGSSRIVRSSGRSRICVLGTDSRLVERIVRIDPRGCEAKVSEKRCPRQLCCSIGNLRKMTDRHLPRKCAEDRQNSTKLVV